MGGELDKDKKRAKTITASLLLKRNERKKGTIDLASKYSLNSKELKMMELIQDKNPKKMEQNLINDCIGKHHFMQSLKMNEKNEIIVNMSLYKVKPYTTLYSQGSPGNFWYIVSKGQVDLFVDGTKKKTFSSGDCFGEFALMNNCPQEGTVKTVTECELWVLNKEVFEKMKSHLYNFKENNDFLRNLKLPISDKIKSSMADFLLKNIYKARDTICKEGDPSTCLYIIKDGEVNFLKNGNIVRTAKRSEFFGEDGLFEPHKRQVEIVAKTNCTIYTISNDFFQDQFIDDLKDQLHFTLLKIAFSQSSKFKSVNDVNLNKAFRFFHFRTFRKNTVIYRKDTDLSKKLCVVLDGYVIDKGTNTIIAKAYNILFEDNVVNGNENKIRNDLISDSNCVIAEANYEDFKHAIGGETNTNSLLMRTNTIGSSNKNDRNNIISSEMKVIEKINLFRHLNMAKKELIEKNLKIEKFNNGDKIQIQGNSGNKLYIIKKGKVDFFLDSKYMKSKFEGDDFGSKSLILEDRKNLTTVVANGPVECYTLTSDVFKNILNPELKQYFLNQYYLNDYSIQLKDFENLKTLGCGSYGVVNLVRSTKNKQLYAVKAMDLMQIKEENILKRVELEKSLLLKMQHPFIAKIVKYIKGEVYLYYIMEYVKGKELFDVMRDINLLNKKQTQFYSASMLEVLNYLHSQKVVYRDLKPENIMVLENGYIKFFDFGTVKEIKSGRTKTFIGTTSYMAPEVFTGKGYSFEVDMWSLGIMMYEFLCGKLPFAEDIEDPMEFYNEMIGQDLTFPPFVNDEAFKDLVSKLLIKDPNKRLTQYSQIRNHQYFKDFDWEKLLCLVMPAPYKFRLHGISENQLNPEPYLTYLKSLGKKPYNKLKASIRQINFKKWLKDF